MPDRAWHRPDAADNPLQRLVRHHVDHRSRRRPAGREDGGGQGQHSRRRRADDERLGDDGGLRRRRATPPSSPACSPPAPRSPARPSARTSASPAARTPRAPARCATRGTRPARPAARRSGSAALVAAGRRRRGHRRRPGRLGAHPERRTRGTVGHKPTWGLVPYTGAFPIELTIDHVGPITRTVADAALVLERDRRARTGSTPASPATSCRDDYVAALARDADGLRIGVVTEGFGHPNSEAGRRRRRAGGDRDAARRRACRRGRLRSRGTCTAPCSLGRDRHRGRDRARWSTATATA